MPNPPCSIKFLTTGIKIQRCEGCFYKNPWDPITCNLSFSSISAKRIAFSWMVLDWSSSHWGLRPSSCSKTDSSWMPVKALFYLLYQERPSVNKIGNLVCLASLDPNLSLSMELELVIDSLEESLKHLCGAHYQIWRNLWILEFPFNNSLELLTIVVICVG